MAGFLAAYRGNTRTSYDTDLRLFKGVVAAVEPGLVRLPPGAAGAVGRWMEEQGLMSSTVARRLSTRTSFYRYRHQEELITRKPAINLRGPKVDYRVPHSGA